MRSRSLLVALWVLAGPACGRLHFEPEDGHEVSVDAGRDAPTLDAPTLDAPDRDDAAMPPLDASTADAPTTDAPDARGSIDVGADAPMLPNRPPVATGGFVTSLVWPVELGFDVSDPDGDVLRVVILRGPEHGSLGPSPTWRYVPEPGFRGIDSVVFAAFDGHAYSQLAELHIAVTNVPAPRGLPPAPTPVTSCGTLSTGAYVLTSDLSAAAADCLVVASPDVTLLGAGHTITGTGTGMGIRGVGASGVRIHDVTISGFTEGIHLEDSPAAEITRVRFEDLAETALWVTGGSDGAVIQEVAFEDVGTGLFVAGGAHQSTMIGAMALRVRDSVSHFYDESRDNFVVGGAYDSVGRAVSCDRCQELKVVGVRAIRATRGVDLVYNCRGHHLARLTLDAPVVGLETVHWGGCGDALLSDVTITGATERTVRFEAGSAHGPFRFLNPSWTETDEENLSGSTSSREHHVVVRAVDAAGAPVAGRSLQVHAATGTRTPFTTDAAGLSPLLTVTASVDAAGTRTSMGPYRVMEGTIERLAALPLDRSIVDVVVP